MPKFPAVKVKLTGEDGNAFFLVSKVRKALEQAGYDDAGREFMDEALSGDYNHVIQTCMEYVTVR